MIRNYFIVAIRSFLRHRFYSLINVAGLASGLMVSLFIFLWVRDEVRTDTFHENSDRIFRIVSNLDFGDKELLTWNITPGPLADVIRESIPEAEWVVRTADYNSALFHYEDKNFLERGYYADPDFFKLFSYKIIKGVNDPVNNKNSMAISEKLAAKLFGDDDPIGKVIKVSGKYDMEVKTVFQTEGYQSSMKFDYVMPFEIYKEQRGEGFNWGNFDHPLYVRLNDASKAEAVMTSINEQANKLNDQTGISFYVQPLTESYLNGQFENGKPVGGRIFYVRLFSIVAIFILIIACINFMNMATAKAAMRAREVGIRKVAGAQRWSLIGQFIGESLFISFISMLVATLMVLLTLPLFNNLVSKEIILDFTDPTLLLAILSIVVISGLLAGSYPAFFLSSYQPAAVLKGHMASALSGAGLRKGLVIFQFTLTVILVACSLVVYNQIEFIRNKNLGYNRESVLSFSARGNLNNQFDAFKNDVLQIPGVENISKSNESLVQVNNQNGSVNWPGKPEKLNLFFRTIVADYDFIETLGLTIVEGRAFAKEFNDSNNMVITQRAADVMGLTNPVGQKISQWGTEGTIVGVAKDFHVRSMHEALDPVIILCKPEWTSRVFVRFDGSQTANVIAGLEGLNNKYVSDYPFTYTFMDDDFEKLYSSEKIIGYLALWFTTMAIIISGLGLIGLAAYTADRKRKEIGIRKSMGASVSSLIGKLSGEFVKLSLIASLIGCPIAYLASDRFLQNYAFHAELSWTIFLITAVAVLLISILIVIFQVMKAAQTNPVEVLRNE